MFRTMFVVLIALIAVSPAFGQEVLVFATSQRTTGSFGGLAGADTLCTNWANAAGLSGGWTAWLSTSTDDARARIIDAEYQLLDGTVIATSLADLTDGTLNAPINLDEDGNDASGSDVWTGTLQDGTFGGDDTCNDWTDATGNFGAVAGDTDPTGPEWTEQPIGILCNNALRLFCFSAFEVPVELQKFTVE